MTFECPTSVRFLGDGIRLELDLHFWPDQELKFGSGHSREVAVASMVMPDPVPKRRTESLASVEAADCVFGDESSTAALIAAAGWAAQTEKPTTKEATTTQTRPYVRRL